MLSFNALRTAPAETQDQTHVHPVLRALAQETITIDGYQNVLKSFYGFYAPLEMRYALSESALLDKFPVGETTEKLRQDLKRHDIDVATLPVMQCPMDAFTPEQAVAYVYVREGAHLGGKAISKNLHTQLGLVPGLDNTYFWGHGQNTGKSWKDFLLVLDQLESSLNMEAVAAYTATLFQMLDGWMQERS